MRLFSGGPDDPEVDSLMEIHVAETLYSAVQCLMHVIWTKDKEAQQDVAHHMRQTAKRWMIWR